VLRTFPESVGRFVQNLVEIGLAVCACKGDLSTISPLYIYILANRAPALPGKNLMSLRHPSGHFTLHKVFSPVIRLGFRVWGTQGSGGRVGKVMPTLRTFPELVGRSVQPTFNKPNDRLSIFRKCFVYFKVFVLITKGIKLLFSIYIWFKCWVELDHKWFSSVTQVEMKSTLLSLII